MVIQWVVVSANSILLAEQIFNQAGGVDGHDSTHLNWQKMSAYSGGMPLACSTVTRKVKMLPTSS